MMKVLPECYVYMCPPPELLGGVALLGGVLQKMYVELALLFFE
jgi:hypothetical protein